MSENFLLSKVRAIHKLGVSEGLHLRYLWTSAIKSYEEFGYSVGIKNYIRLGLYIGFDGYHYNNIGVSVSFPWLSGGY